MAAVLFIVAGTSVGTMLSRRNEGTPAASQPIKVLVQFRLEAPHAQAVIPRVVASIMVILAATIIPASGHSQQWKLDAQAGRIRSTLDPLGTGASEKPLGATTRTRVPVARPTRFDARLNSDTTDEPA